MKEIRTLFATLKAERVQEYQTLHDHIPVQNLTHMSEAGYQTLSIFQHGLTLVMRVEKDSTLVKNARFIDQEAEQRWRDLTEPCFAQSWQEMASIFEFQARDEA